MLTLLIAIPIIVSDTTTTRDSWCQKPQTMQSQGYCSRRVSSEPVEPEEDNGPSGGSSEIDMMSWDEIIALGEEPVADDPAPRPAGGE